MADRRLRRHLSQDEMNRGIGMLHSGLSQRHVAISLVCPRVLSPEYGTGLLRPEMLGICMLGARTLNQSGSRPISGGSGTAPPI